MCMSSLCMYIIYNRLNYVCDNDTAITKQLMHHIVAVAAPICIAIATAISRLTVVLRLTTVSLDIAVAIAIHIGAATAI